MRRFVPLGIFIALVVLLGVGLGLNPSLVPSPLVGKSTPEFSLPTVKSPDKTLGSADLKGQVSLLNVWATWCVSCRHEHPLLVELSKSGSIPIYGLNYKDDRSEALRWLGRLGDPYIASAYDPDGKVGIDFGVYGLPETFVLDKNGMIAYKHVGPITVEDWQQKILPVLNKLRRTEG